MLHTNSAAYVYNPDRQSERELIDNFVIRKEEFTDLFRELKTAPMTNPEQHFIVQGVRGSGKTTLLLRLFYAIRRDEDLNKRIVAVRFPEEQYNIRTLTGIWETVLEMLEHDPEHPEFKGTYDGLIERAYNEGYDRKAFAFFRDVLRERGKKLILFIDNFGELLNKFTEIEQHHLREILITSPDIRIVGGAAKSQTLEQFYRYDKPFYNYFDMVRLGGLDKNETFALLRKLAEGRNDERVQRILDNEPEKVEVLRRLTGGIPRTIVLLFEVFADDRNGNSMKNLELLLDRVTPLYKHRMDDLSAQQQAIVDAIALAWDAVGVKYIAEKVRMESKAVSAQLNLLEKNWIIEKEPTSKKNHLYRIHERFFNIWYLMRNSRRGEREKVVWLVRFLESWCGREELAQRADKILQCFDRPDYDQQYAQMMAVALAETRELPEELRAQLSATLYGEKQDHSDISKKEEVGKSKLELIDLLLTTARSGDTDTMLILGHLYRERGEEAEAGSWWLKAAEGGNVDAMYFLGNWYQERGEISAAETWLFRAAEGGNADAMYYRGGVYWSRGQETTAATWWLKAAEKDPRYYLPLALLVFQLNDVEKSINHASSFLAVVGPDQFHIPIFLESIQSYFTLLLARGMFNSALHLIQTYDLKDKLKPIYYALMYYMQDEYPDEYKKMGSELKQTVEEIVKEIDKLKAELKEKKQAH